MDCVRCGYPTLFPVKTKDGVICPQCAIDTPMIDFSTSNIPEVDVTGTAMSIEYFENYVEKTYAPMPEVAKYLLPSGAISLPPFAALRPADPALEAIGRAFDDALDLAYLS